MLSDEHYLDKTGLECDAVLQSWNGSYALVEIKLGGETLIEEGAATLNKLADLINAKKCLRRSSEWFLLPRGLLPIRGRMASWFV